ncbi:hypothetical protein TorRG33x02_196120, partial [Trema orientale]
YSYKYHFIEKHYWSCSTFISKKDQNRIISEVQHGTFRLHVNINIYQITYVPLISKLKLCLHSQNIKLLFFFFFWVLSLLTFFFFTTFIITLFNKIFLKLPLPRPSRKVKKMKEAAT